MPRALECLKGHQKGAGLFCEERTAPTQPWKRARDHHAHRFGISSIMLPMLSAFDSLASDDTSASGHTCEHDVGQFLHEKVCERNMQPRVGRCQSSSQYSTDDKDSAEEAQHALKVGHATLPLLEGTMTGQSKNRLK